MSFALEFCGDLPAKYSYSFLFCVGKLVVYCHFIVIFNNNDTRKKKK